MTQEQKLERFAERELKRVYTELIIDDEQGGYVAFGRYYLRPQDSGIAVYQSEDLVAVFSNKRTAISYCVADRFNQLKLAREIEILDFDKQKLDTDLETSHLQITRTKSTDLREMIQTKIQNKLATRRVVNAELEKCLNSAKYLQLRGFSNETARTSRT